MDALAQKLTSFTVSIKQIIYQVTWCKGPRVGLHLKTGTHHPCKISPVVNVTMNGMLGVSSC